MDIDFSFRGGSFSEDNLRTMINEIISVKVNDIVSFVFFDIRKIRKEDEYGGYRIRLLAKLENIRQIIAVDIATGDPITPNEIDYRYKCYFSEESFNLKSYNLETILSEKIQTILFKGVTSSRYKDLFDVYILWKLRFDGINKEDFKLAFNRTCEYRNTKFTKEYIVKKIYELKNSSIMEEGWEIFSGNNLFARNIEFSDVIESLMNVIEMLNGFIHIIHV